jgi:hypothetical protein
VRQPALLVEDLQEAMRQVADAALEDALKGFLAGVGREHAGGEELAEAGVGPGELQDVLELAQGRLGRLAAAAGLGQLEEAAGVDLGEGVGLCVGEGHRVVRG